MIQSGKSKRKIAAVLAVSVIASVGCSATNESKFAFWQNKEVAKTPDPALQAEYVALNQKLTDMQQLSELLKDYIADLRKLQQANQPKQESQPVTSQAIIDKSMEVQVADSEQAFMPQSRNYYGMKLSVELASMSQDMSHIARVDSKISPDNVEAWPSSTAAGHVVLPPSTEQALSRLQLPSKTAVEPVKSAEPIAAPQEQGPVFRISFPVSSAELAVSQEMEKQLLKAAAESKQILIRGYTDAEVSTAYSERVAAERAQAAYQFLIKHGISADKVVISSSGAKDFYRDNNSEEGREQNRRVEIVMSDTASAVVQNKPENKSWSSRLSGLIGLKF